eukprot:TRINITY_DN2630_c0_g1_i15.p2 TRINITY_DN2630_c0_g1~~TRINITY_DN2630_c0_g1_i15.p2  ORF type:complete len:103 (+),score=18.89 TRINITY_DN2630_c0_g1_i15:154-462(+)
MGIFIMRRTIFLILLLISALAFKYPTGEEEEKSPYDDVDDYILLFRLYRSDCVCKRTKDTGDICVALECCDRYEYIPKEQREAVCSQAVCKFFDIEEMTIVE